MRRRDRKMPALAASGLMLLCLLAGCASDAVKMAPDQHDRAWVPQTDAKGEIVAGATPAASDARAPYVLPVNTDLTNTPTAAQLDSKSSYTLAELIDIAQSNNPATRIAWNNARNAALAAGIAQAAFLPQLSVNALAGDEWTHSSATVGPLSASGNNHGTGYAEGVGLQWLLFDFGGRQGALDAARQLSVAANIGFTGAHQKVIFDVAAAYYTNAAAVARVNSAAQTLQDARKVQTAAEARYAKGIGTVVEVAQARQATAQAQLLVVQTQGDAANAYLGVISAIGISPLTKIKIAALPQRPLSPSMAKPAESVVADALGRRPDILAAYAADKAALAQVDAAKAAFMPKVYMTGSVTHASGDLNASSFPSLGEGAPSINISNHQTNGTVLLGVTMPVYDGGTRDALLSQARNQADTASVTLQHTRDEAVRQIAVASNTLRTSLQAYSAAQTLRSAAQTTFDAAFAAYQNGVGSITEVSQAQAGLLQARNASTDTYSAALAAAAALALSSGSLGSAASL